MLGGTIHQAGVIASAGQYAITHNLNKISWDHSSARNIASGIQLK